MIKGIKIRKKATQNNTVVKKNVKKLTVQCGANIEVIEIITLNNKKIVTVEKKSAF